MPATFQGPPPVPSGADLPALMGWAQRATEVLRGLMQGRMNVTGEVTLTTGTTTVLKDPRLSSQSALLLDPMTANAAGVAWHALAGDRLTAEWTIRHPSGAADRTFRYVVIG